MTQPNYLPWPKNWGFSVGTLIDDEENDERELFACFLQRYDTRENLIRGYISWLEFSRMLDMELPIPLIMIEKDRGEILEEIISEFDKKRRTREIERQYLG